MHRFPVFRLTTQQFVLIAALFFTTLGNLPLWRQLASLVSLHDLHGMFFALSLPVFFFVVFYIFFSLLAWPYLRKPLFAFFLMTSAACCYFMLNYQVIIDRGMIQNILETDPAEAGSYFSLALVLYLILLGALPTVLLFRVRFEEKHSLGERAATWCGGFVLSLLVVAGLASFFYKDYASLFRNNRTIVSTILPINYLKGTYSYLHRRYESQQPLVAIGTDAVRSKPASTGRPRLLVLVVGETARAKNFALNGYERQTNPRLSQRNDIIAFQNVSSCGTATAVSLPCMFSPMTRENFNETRAAHEENLVDVLQRTGVQLLWRENNNGGCKGLCNRVPSEDMPKTKNPEFCKNADGTCYDNVLLAGLDEKIQAMTDDGMIVLHQLGSHGPTYFARYSEDEKRFAPTCDTNQIQNCNTESLTNTYDNTLVYTDKMLDETITLLQRYAETRDTAMIYLSDHGESLGEKGFYLHGTPYFMAPDEQTHIPMVMWFSPPLAADSGIDLACLRKNAQNNAYSQDNLFSSILGFFSVRTQEYRRDLDLFEDCRNSGASKGTQRVERPDSRKNFGA